MRSRRYYRLYSISNKILSSCVVLLIILASFVIMTNNAIAIGGNDIITTYSYYGSFNQTTTFSNEDSVFVNVSVDNVTGDPLGDPYYVKALNVNTGEWVKVYVFDNDTNPPFNDNSPGDGIYWGSFNVSSSNSSNASGPGSDSVLNVSVGDTINISEDPASQLDGDPEIAYALITIADGGGGNNPPDQPNTEQPGNRSIGVPVNTNLSWNCSDPDGDPLTYDIYFGNSTPPSQVEINTSNMSYNPVGDLEYNTTYYWYVVAWDINNASTYSSQWWFTTESQGGGGNNPPDPPTQEIPANGTPNVPINTNLSWNCSDPDGDPLTYDIYCGNNSPPPQVWQNYTSTSYYYNLTYNTTYYWHIVAWDNHNASTTGPIWSFATGTEESGPGNESGNGTILGFVLDVFDSPIPNATVVLNRTDQPQMPQIVLTNDTGEYIFNNVTSGYYEIEVFKEGYMSNNRSLGHIYANETRWENFTIDAGGSFVSNIYVDEWQSSVSPTYIFNNTQGKLNFTIKMYGGPDSRITNLTILIPPGFRYEGNNGTSLTDTSNFTVINTDNVVSWQKTNQQGFFFTETSYYWFNVSTNASLGLHEFNITVCYGNDNTTETIIKRVFTTTTFYAYGSIKDHNGNPLQGAVANITVNSFSRDGPINLGSFTDETDENGFYNVTDIPAIENVSNLNLSGPMGPGGGDEGGLFYQLNAQENSGTYSYLAVNISASLPSVPVTEFIRMLQNAEIYLKPALTFRVNVTGNTYVWNETNHSLDTVYGLKNFSIMVKDQKLGYPVKEFNTMGGERVFSVPRDRNYSFTVFADQSFPVSIRFNNIFARCEANESLDQQGVTTSYMACNGTYLINVSIDVASTNRKLTGVFNNITNPTDMRVVTYTMEDQDMVFEDWAMPYNLGNETGDGPDDQYYLSNCTYSIYLPATNASSYLLLRAYACNASGYYMGSAMITASNQTLSSSTVDFDMLPLIQGGTSRIISASNVSNQWNDTPIVNTTAALFRLVSNGELLSNENPFVEIKREINGQEYKQMINGQNGLFNISLVEGESLNELTIYSQQYAPISTPVNANILNGSINTSTISCSNGVCNITMRRFGEFDPFGKNASMMIRMFKSNDTCNVPNPPGFCDLCGGGPGQGNSSGVMDKKDFSPFKAILKGDISMMIMSNTSEGWIYVYYINVDLLASGPPDATFSTDSQEAEGGLAKAWQFGSQGPDIYDRVLIGIPLSDDLINKTVKVEIPLLYDNEFNIIWNATAGDTVDTIRNNSVLNNTYGDYLGTEYEAYLNGTGVICSTTDSTLSTSLAYKDVVNHTIWIKIPHFSGVGPQVTGEEPDPPENFTATANSTSEIYLTWTKPAKADYIRIQRKTGGYPINITDGTNVYNGTGTSTTDSSLLEGTTYYYAAWSWNQTGGYWSVNSSTAYVSTKSTPYHTGVAPADGKTNAEITPALHVLCVDNDSDTMTAYWYSNSSGSWVLFATNTSISSGTNITQTNSNFSNYDTTYWWSVNLTDSTSWRNQTYRFTTRSQYTPAAPSSFTATAASSSSIILSWTKGNNSDYTRIQRKTGGYPINITDGTNVYNGTGTSTTDSGLTASTTYYYRAWGWNAADNIWSTSNVSDTATTSSANTGSSGSSASENQQQEAVEEEQQEEQSANTSSSQTAINEINETFNVELEKPFYANDTDDDGIVDVFVDPNNQLIAVNTTTINDSIAFLISTDEDEIPEFFWNPTDDAVTKITHSTATVKSTIVDTENETVTITVSINKSNWVYIGVTDEYPEYNLTVKTSDGRIISSDKIWRKDNKIYVLDDPDTEYNFIYEYTIIPPTFNPISGTSFETAKPTIVVTYWENVTIESSKLNNEDIVLLTSNNKIFTYSPEKNLSNGDYSLVITAKDNSNNTRTDTALYTIDVQTSDETKPIQEIPWIFIILAVVAAIWAVIILLFKTGFLYVERKNPPKK